ncbi:membrane protein [Aliivibrio wodanis]|uniref:Membrane protein n=1 Tax=Aliivibrio wodanis TaxID=80852 RepID=A0A090IN52_9GAMM|nr:membrane protein [Aliivibrio wodanis]VVV03295.1 hypothetical protein AW0309160_00663 [Aliivibrio wodanis]
MYHFSHKIWIPFVTVFAFFIASLLLTSQLSSSLRTNNPFSVSEVTSGCPQQDHSVSGKYELDKHHCCASMCLLKVPCGQSISVGLTILATRSLILEDRVDKAIVRSKTLFRPPIV